MNVSNRASRAQGAMGAPSKYSIEWHGNKGYEDGIAGRAPEVPHDGILDRLVGFSGDSRAKRDAYMAAYEKGKRERNRR
jgi:hypothetical protein